MTVNTALGQVVYTLQGLSGFIGFLASCWIIHTMYCKSLPFAKTFPGFVVLVIAYLDGFNGLFFVLNTFQSKPFGRLWGRNSSLIPTDEIFFVIYSNLWDWSQISSAFVCFTLVWQVYYILDGGVSRTLQRRKWIIFLIVMFLPIPIYFGVYSIVQRVPIYFAGRYAYLITDDNSELCYSVLCRWLTPDGAMFWLITLTTLTNLILSTITHLNLTGQMANLQFNKRPPNSTQLLIMRLVMAFSIASVSIWVPYIAICIYLKTKPYEESNSTDSVYWILMFIRMAFSPARGLWHALALAYTLELRNVNVKESFPPEVKSKTPVFASKKIELYCGSDSLTSITMEKWDFPDSVYNRWDTLETPVQSFRYDI